MDLTDPARQSRVVRCGFGQRDGGKNRLEYECHSAVICTSRRLVRSSKSHDRHEVGPTSSTGYSTSWGSGATARGRRPTPASCSCSPAGWSRSRSRPPDRGSGATRQGPGAAHRPEAPTAVAAVAAGRSRRRSGGPRPPGVRGQAAEYRRGDASSLNTSRPAW
jgi:hypothetical protein